MTLVQVICPKCGEVAKKTNTKYGRRDDCCGLWSWDSKPLTDRATHEARKNAHAALDAVWKKGTCSRTEAYRRLSEFLGIALDECHMAQMDERTAKMVPPAVSVLWPRNSR